MPPGNELPPPAAQGVLAKTPFAHLLVYALERQLTGTIELTGADGSSVATLLVIEGHPQKVRTAEEVALLGGVLLELGLITQEQNDTSVAQLAESPRLHGQILLEAGAINDEQLTQGLTEQLERKLAHLFDLPPETSFLYYDGFDALSDFGGDVSLTLEPLRVLWAGIQQNPSWEHVHAALTRVGTAAIRIAANAQVERFAFTRGEQAAIDLLRKKPQRLFDLTGAKVLAPSAAQLLVYCLLVTKQLELVEAPPSVRPMAAAQPSAPPPQAQSVSAPPPAPSSSSQSVPPASPSSASNIAGREITGSQLARMQLQQRAIARQPAPVAVEERAVTKATDTRIATPMPAMIPRDSVPDGAGASSLAALVSSTLASAGVPEQAPSVAPPAAAPPSPAPAAPSSGPPVRDVPAAAPSASQLPKASGEHNALRTRILDRAMKIESQDYFQMLGIEATATADQVQKAYFSAAKVWHPDRLPPALGDVKDACAKVFAHLSEAQATLTDPQKRAQYMMLLRDGGATAEDQAKIQAVLEAARDFQMAEHWMKRNDMAQAETLARKAYELDHEQIDYLVLVTWFDAQKPAFLGREKTMEKIAILDKAINRADRCERAYFYRGLLYKRIDQMKQAVKDFQRASELNPRNLDAIREVRLYNMRGGPKSLPPGKSGSIAPKGDGLFGRLFKK